MGKTKSTPSFMPKTGEMDCRKKNHNMVEGGSRISGLQIVMKKCRTKQTDKQGGRRQTKLRNREGGK